ncbi:MAG: glycosyltransferase family 2 protein [Actinomycetia bacterium]|nr:glycosyltransferase family 2 protein [Actinomycetes bacterium]
MPSVRTVWSAVTGAARSTLTRGIRQTPWLYDAARSTYFDLANLRLTQDLAYREWLQAHRVSGSSLAQRRLHSRSWERQRYLSLVVDVAGADPGQALRLVRSVVTQAYEQWELLVCSDLPFPLPERGLEQERIRTLARPGSRVERLNEALERCQGDFVCFLTTDDVLYPTTCYELVAALEACPGAEVSYGGEDLVDLENRPTGTRYRRREPFFKPDWNPELLRSAPYLGSATLLRTSLVRAVGGFRDLTGADDPQLQLWDLQLRVTERAAGVAHVVEPVASRRAGLATIRLPDEAGAETGITAGVTAVLRSAATAEGRPDAAVRRQPELPEAWQTRYPVVGEPLVSIVVPSKNQLQVVRRCIESVLDLTAYQKYEIVLVDTGSDDPQVRQWYAETADHDDRFRVVDWPEQPWSYARSCNEGAHQARGEVLVMLNNDTEVLDPDWLDVLVGEAQRPEVGAVGCLLLYPDATTVQHAGVGLGIKGVAGNSLAGLRLDQDLSRTQRTLLWTRRATTAVTAACLAVRAEVYHQVDGFDEAFRVTFNDVDLCCRIGELGLRNVYTPYTRLLHHESLSVATTVAGGRDWSELTEAAELFRQRWGALLERDPQMNPHLSKATTSYRLVHRGR